MLVPFVAVRALDVTDIALRQTTGEQTLPSEIGCKRIVKTIEFFGRLRFLIDFKCLRRLRLHAERKFQGFDARFELRIVLAHLGVTTVDVLDHVQLKALVILLQPLTQEILDGLVPNIVDLESSVSDCGALVSPGKKRGTPILGPTVGERGFDRDEPG